MSNNSMLHISLKNFKHRLLSKKRFLNQSSSFVYTKSYRHLTSVTRVGGFSNFDEERLTYKLSIPKHFNFASDILDQWASKEKNGHRTADIPALWYVSDEDKEIKLSFEELKIESKRIASILQSQCGVKKGDHVIVMLPKIPEFWLVFIASLRIRSILSPATMQLTVKDLVYRLEALKPECVVAHESVTNIVDEASNSYKSLQNKVIISDKPTKRSGWIDLNHIQPDRNDHQCALTNSNDSMIIYFTSGTTGHPKMVEHTHASYGICLRDYGKYNLDLTSNNIFWGMTDTGWALTAYNLFGAWTQGACLFIHEMPKFSAIKTLQTLAKYPIDTMCAGTFIYRALVQENLQKFKFNKLEHCFSGGETLNTEVIRKWLENTGLRIYNGYGQTETVILTATRKSIEYRIGSIGKSMPGLAVKIVDKEENEVGPRIVGEIVVERKSTPAIFKQYRNNPEATKASLTEKYLHTGDFGYYDEDDFFWFVGRNDDIINSAGYRIGPSEVENALMDHPAVAEVAVTSSPDHQRGEIVKAFIRLTAATQPSENLIKELQDHCKRTTAPYKYPRKIEFLTEFPRTSSGKIKRSELRQKEWKHS